MSKPTTTKKAKTPTKETKVASVHTGVPSGTWPGAWALYKPSKEAVMYNIWVYLLLILIPGAVSSIISSLDLPTILDSGLNYAVSTIFTVASTLVILAAIRRKKIDLNTSLKKSFTTLSLEAFGLFVLCGLILVGSFIAFVIPFFFVAPRLSLATYYLIDKRMGIIDSIKASWNKTQGHVGKVYGIVGVNIAMALLMVTIIGIPFSIYFLIMYSAALPLLYLYIEKKA